MNFCIFDDDAVCRNDIFENNYGHRCIEADNLLKNEQTMCRYRILKRNNASLDTFKKQNEKETTKSDTVMHPSHYCQGGIECIKAIEASMTPEEFQGYCKGNVMKYIWRFREKNGLEDLKKAQVYLGWMIESKEKQEKVNAD